MNRILRVLAAALFVAACAEVLPIAPQPVAAEDNDLVFKLVVRSPASRYAPGQPITVSSEIVYLGPKARETMYHASSPVGWTIEQLDGPARMGGGMDLPCLRTEVAAGAPHNVPFAKGGVPDDVGPFTRAWYQEQALRLPAGRWRIVAQLSVSLDDCGGEPHALVVPIEVLVAP